MHERVDGFLVDFSGSAWNLVSEFEGIPAVAQSNALYTKRTGAENCMIPPARRPSDYYEVECLIVVLMPGEMPETGFRG